MSKYSKLDPVPVHATIGRLGDRIRERFPGSGLSGVAAQLLRLSEQNDEVIVESRRPLWWLRALIFIAIAAVVGVVLWAGIQLVQVAKLGVGGLADVLQATEAAVNELIFLSIALFFLLSLEVRFKRRSILRMLHRLRALAHVVDMHQLTKDPELLIHPLPATPSSPTRILSSSELVRYLEYCSEMLSLASKLAALHTQHLDDPVVLDAVNDIENLTSGLSRKVWQKITVLDIAERHLGVEARPSSGAAAEK